MTSFELRQKYLQFFKEKGHAIIPSASLIPENDPSVLFTTAGMHPLVPYLLGEKHPAGHRLVDVQKCVRTGDIDEVGDSSHLTFFEMLGNWSLGDYFKKESIAWSYEFLTDKKWLGIDPQKLAVTIFAGDESAPRDEESAGFWQALGLPKERLAYLGKDDNWWPAGGKNLGPQGPDTEIFYWTGAGAAPKKFDPADKNWLEIWNNVFMQFNLTADGQLLALQQKNVDTGMGLERTVAVLQEKKSPYETDLFISIIEKIEEMTGKKYGANVVVDRSIRIIADHLRAAVFILGDEHGVVPSNVEQGYVLRRLIRRAIRHAKLLGITSEFIVTLARQYIDLMGTVYPELKENHVRIVDELKKEEAKFDKTVEKGVREFEKIFSKKKAVSGEDAFILYSTYGFPLELTQEMAKEKGQETDIKKFKEEFEKHQNLSRAGAEQKFVGGLADHGVETTRLHTATHLLNQALRLVLGEHVFQKGSNITTERLRFDFSHGEKMTKEQIKQVEEIVNEQINKKLPMHFEILDIEQAKKLGAIGVFEDKYASLGNQIKVYFAGEKDAYFSKEVCGGPHVDNTGELGTFKILKEEAVAAGIRRIKAVLQPKNR